MTLTPGEMVDLDDPRVRTALRTLGTRYSWGLGSPETAAKLFPGGPWDCMGHIQCVLVETGILDRGQIDRSAHAMAYCCYKVDPPYSFGDMVFYGERDTNRGGSVQITHAAMLLGPGPLVITASGGGSKTHGDDPRAHVKLVHMDYRSDLVVVGRLRNKYRTASARIPGADDL